MPRRGIFDNLNFLRRKPGQGLTASDPVGDSAEDLGYVNFKKILDTVCYKHGSRRTKVSILRCFKKYLEMNYGKPFSRMELSYHISCRDEVHDFAMLLAQEGFRSQTVRDYVGTVRWYFGESKGRFRDEFDLNGKFKRTYRLFKLACGKHQIKKAPPIFRQQIDGLPAELRSLALVWLMTGVRKRSLMAISQVTSLPCGGILAFSSDWKFLDANLDQCIEVKCNCHNALGSRYCVIHDPDLVIPVLPPLSKTVDKLLSALGATGHSFRRTLAIELRYRANLAGIGNEEINDRVNAHFKWARFSHLIGYYAPDYKRVCKFETVPLPGVTNEIVEKTVKQLQAKYRASISMFKKKSLSLWHDID